MTSKAFLAIQSLSFLLVFLTTEQSAHVLAQCSANNECPPSTPFCSDEVSNGQCVECLSDGDCDDGSACNGIETCSDGTCVPAVQPLPDGTPCNDDRYCTSNDECFAGICLGSDSSCLEGEYCDELNSQCRADIDDRKIRGLWLNSKWLDGVLGSDCVSGNNECDGVDINCAGYPMTMFGVTDFIATDNLFRVAEDYAIIETPGDTSNQGIDRFIAALRHRREEMNEVAWMWSGPKWSRTDGIGDFETDMDLIPGTAQQHLFVSNQGCEYNAVICPNWTPYWDYMFDRRARAIALKSIGNPELIGMAIDLEHSGEGSSTNNPSACPDGIETYGSACYCDDCFQEFMDSWCCLSGLTMPSKEQRYCMLQQWSICTEGCFDGCPDDCVEDCTEGCSGGCTEETEKCEELCTIGCFETCGGNCVQGPPPVCEDVDLLEEYRAVQARKIEELARTTRLATHAINANFRFGLALKYQTMVRPGSCTDDLFSPGDRAAPFYLGLHRGLGTAKDPVYLFTEEYYSRGWHTWDTNRMAFGRHRQLWAECDENGLNCSMKDRIKHVVGMAPHFLRLEDPDKKRPDADQITGETLTLRNHITAGQVYADGTWLYWDPYVYLNFEELCDNGRDDDLDGLIDEAGCRWICKRADNPPECSTNSLPDGLCCRGSNGECCPQNEGSPGCCCANGNGECNVVASGGEAITLCHYLKEIREGFEAVTAYPDAQYPEDILSDCVDLDGDGIADNMPCYCVDNLMKDGNGNQVSGSDGKSDSEPCICTPNVDSEPCWCDYQHSDGVYALQDCDPSTCSGTLSTEYMVTVNNGPCYPAGTTGASCTECKRNVCSSNSDCADSTCIDAYCETLSDGNECQSTAMACTCSVDSDCHPSKPYCVDSACESCGDDSHCDDGDPLTLDQCVDNNCINSFVGDCDNGVYCDGSEVLQDGVCVRSGPLPCEENEVCVEDAVEHCRQRVLYVRSGSSGTSGRTWDDAFNHLSEALDVIKSGDEPYVTEIRIAEGVYQSIGGANALESTILINEINGELTLRGGYVCDPVSFPLACNERDSWNNRTVFTGNLGSEFSEHVLKISNATGPVILDGLFIQSGKVVIDGTEDPIEDRGAGIQIKASDVRINRCVIRDNIAVSGGGIFVDNGSLLVKNTMIVENQASGLGGGVAVSDSDVWFINVTIADNINSLQLPELRYHGLIAHNSKIKIDNSIVWNPATATDEIRLSSQSSLTVRFSNIPGGQSSIVADSSSSFLWDQGVPDCNLSLDPQFVDEDASCDLGYCIGETSPCRDAGNDLLVDDSKLDLLGDPRIKNTHVDMGATEQGCTVDSDCDDSFACTSETCNLTNNTCDYITDDSACDDGEFCNGIELCVVGQGCVNSPDLGAGTPCGDPADTPCDNPDTCDGLGMCRSNLELPGIACGDPSDTECDNADTCDGLGFCRDNFEPIGFNCGNANDTECDAPDTCDGMGVCNENLVPAGLACGDSNDTECDNADTCDGLGFCLDNFEPIGSSCGDSSDTECDNADACDGNGVCKNNFESIGVACDDGLFCNGLDECDGSGTCVSAGDPCLLSLICNEELDKCVECEENSDCGNNVGPKIFDYCDCATNTCHTIDLDVDQRSCQPVVSPLPTPFACNDGDDDVVCSFEYCSALGSICESFSTRYGDVSPPFGIVQNSDITCAIAGFGNYWACPNADIAGCAPSGMPIGIADIGAVINAFGGTDPCNCDPVPSCIPASAPLRTQQAQETIVQFGEPTAKIVMVDFGSSFIEFDVYIADVNRLSGYEICLEAKDASGRPLKLASVEVDDKRHDYVFFEHDAYPLIDHEFGRIGAVAILDDVNIGKRNDSRYGGTFRFELPPDVKVDEVSVRANDRFTDMRNRNNHTIKHAVSRSDSAKHSERLDNVSQRRSAE